MSILQFLYPMGLGLLSILSEHSHHLAQMILLAGRPFINLTVSDWLADQIVCILPVESMGKICNSAFMEIL